MKYLKYWNVFKILFSLSFRCDLTCKIADGVLGGVHFPRKPVGTMQKSNIETSEILNSHLKFDGVRGTLDCYLENEDSCSFFRNAFHSRCNLRWKCAQDICWHETDWRMRRQRTNLHWRHRITNWRDNIHRSCWQSPSCRHSAGQGRLSSEAQSRGDVWWFYILPL